MALPKNLSELPLHILLKINELCFTEDRPVPQFYLRLALVNKRFHELFMSDRIWAILDVHEVENNISAHYLELKAAMSPVESVFCGDFNFATWRHPAVTLAVFNDFSLYTQAGVLTETNGIYRASRSPLYYKINNLQLLRYAARVKFGLDFATFNIWMDDAFMMSVANAGGRTILYASPRLQDNKEFVLKCVSTRPDALIHCSRRLQGDKQVVLAHFEKWSENFTAISNELQGDPEVAMAAIAKDPQNLRFCTERLQANRQVVFAAVKSDKSLVWCASDELQRELDPQPPLVSFTEL